MSRSADDEDRATAEAARWLVALADDPDNAALRARFEAWLSASPANPAAWTNTSDIYDMMGKVPPAHAGHWASHAPAITRRLVAGAVAAAMAACVALVVLPAVLLRLEADHATATAELRSIRLKDGSAVHLGGDSAIAIAFAQDERRVRLLKGEAYFEVTPGTDRPFRVATREIETTVGGTAFEVRLQGDAVAVAVREGKVRVDYGVVAPPVSERLTAGDQVRVGWGGDVERSGVSPDDIAAWRHGQIVARDRPMGEVVDELRRYYRGTIVVADGAFGRKRVTGVYHVADPAAALQAIVGAHGGVARRISPWLLVVSGG